LTERDLRVGVIGVAGGWSSEALADAIAERTDYRLLVDMDEVVFDIQAGRVMFGEVDLCSLDGLIVKKVGETYGPDMLDRLETLRYVADSGVRLFSRPQSMLRLLDRLACTVTLKLAGVPIPPTMVTESSAHAADIVRQFGTAVLKPLYSTKARGMVVLTGDDDRLEARIRDYQGEGNPVLYVQKKLRLPGRDYGVVFLGGRHLGTYARVGAGDSWNTTIHSGGTYEAHDPAGDLVDLARRAQEPFDLDFTTVDVAESDQGLVVFEVSAFGGFRGSREGLGLDVPTLYAEFVIERLRNG